MLIASDLTAVIACVISAGAFWVSYRAWAQTQDSMSLYLGNDYLGPCLYLTNNSPHAVTIVGFGILQSNGLRSSFMGEDIMRKRMEPRDSCELRVSDEAAACIRRSKGKSGRWCCYIELATGHRFYQARKLTRCWWWCSGWVNGSRRDAQKNLTT